MRLREVGHLSRRRAKARAARLALALTALMAVGYACAPGIAHAHQPEVAGVQGAPSHDVQVRGPSPLYSGLAGTDGTVTSYQLGDGQIVRVQVSPQYEGDPVVQRLLTSLESLLLASPEGMARTCGSGATGCYARAAETIVLPGGSAPSSMPFEMMVAHEYGHHVGRNRENDPWFASYWGPKRWASYEGVCQGVMSGQLYAGDGEYRYWDQPGEAFAQAYAFLHYPNVVPWWWSFAEPDQGALDAIRADVAYPETASTQVWAGRLSRGKRRASMTVSTPLDGQLRARLRSRRGARYSLTVRSTQGPVLRRTKAAQRARVGYTVCGTRSLRLEVRRASGKGRFKVEIRKP
jgi:hypothetical protein